MTKPGSPFRFNSMDKKALMKLEEIQNRLTKLYVLAGAQYPVDSTAIMLGLAKVVNQLDNLMLSVKPKPKISFRNPPPAPTSSPVVEFDSPEWDNFASVAQPYTNYIVPIVHFTDALRYIGNT